MGWGGSGQASQGISDSLLDSLHGDGERHPWKVGSEKLLDLSEQEKKKTYTLFSFFAWTQVTANVLLYIDQGPFATALQGKLWDTDEDRVVGRSYFRSPRSQLVETGFEPRCFWLLSPCSFHCTMLPSFLPKAHNILQC